MWVFYAARMLSILQMAATDPSQTSVLLAANTIIAMWYGSTVPDNLSVNTSYAIYSSDHQGHWRSLVMALFDRSNHYSIPPNESTGNVPDELQI